MTHSSELIVLAFTKTGEKSLVLHTLSPLWGRRSFICTVSRSSGMSLFSPLNILNAEIVENPKSDLWRLHAISAAYPLSGIRNNIYKNTMSLFLSEVLYRTIKDGANEEGLFEWCRKSILTLDSLESDFSNYHLRFLLELAGALGFAPSGDGSPGAGGWGEAEGSASLGSASLGGGLASFAGKHYRTLLDLTRLSFAETMLLPLSGESRNEIAQILLRYLSYHTESDITARSLPVLRELFR